LWILNSELLNEIKKNHSRDDGENFNKITNKFIKKVNDCLSNFSYNVLIASFYEMYGFLKNEIKKQYSKKTLINNYSKILTLMVPVIPHFANEALQTIEIEKINWPEYEKKYLIENIIPIVIQINGKKRALLSLQRDLNEDQVLGEINKDKNILKYIENKKIKKTIYIKDKLINIII